MLLIPILATAFFILIFLYYNNKYQKTAYYKITRYSYLSVLNNSGRYGEYLAYRHLDDFDKNGAKFLFNLYLPKGDSETTEIDMLMICSNGIFVFESKNYSGWIFGSENQKNWYQTLPSGKRSHKEVFYNPIMQNRSHIKHLKKLIPESIPVYSIVVFSDKCVLKDIQIDSYDVNLIYLSQIFQTVFDICSYSNLIVLDENSITEIYDTLYPYSQTSEWQRIQHIQNIQAHKDTNYSYKSQRHNSEYHPYRGDNTAAESNANNSSRNTQNLQCPKCGGNLVLRTSKQGANAGNQFYGCSNYPRCKYIKNIK